MAFELCKSLEQITIPSSVKTIGGRAFNLCSNLKKISFPDKVHYGERTYSVKEPSEENKKIAAMVSKLAATDERDSEAIDQIFDNFIKSMLSNSDSDE